MTPASCNPDGTASVAVGGGTAAYTYLWSNNATTSTLSALAAGPYSVTVTDANGCSAISSVTVTQLSGLTATATELLPILCNGGSATIDVTASGGTGPYTGTGIFTSTAGLQTFTVTDANNCTASATITLLEPAALSASVNILNPIACNGGFAVIDVIASGGTPTYTGVGTFPGIAAGTHIYNISDANGCTASASITLTEPAVLSATIASQTNVACNNGNTGSIDVTVSGGTGTYTYAWTNSATSEDLTSIAAGTYTVNVTDANGCTASTSTSITEPTALTLTPSMTPASCNPDGTASVAVGGGTAAYTYLWSNNATTSTLSALAAGPYSVTVTDANGCSAISSVNVLQSTGLNLDPFHDSRFL
jgi:hypothetical protein